jgi:hypothetical protein
MKESCWSLWSLLMWSDQFPISLLLHKQQCLLTAPLLVLLVTADIAADTTEDDTTESASESFSFFF